MKYKPTLIGGKMNVELNSQTNSSGKRIRSQCAFGWCTTVKGGAP